VVKYQAGAFGANAAIKSEQGGNIMIMTGITRWWPAFGLVGLLSVALLATPLMAQTTQQTPPAQEEFDWAAIGPAAYTANCMACHQANGQGIPRAFPPLAAHAPKLVAAESGREYLIKTVLYGLMGPITVLGNQYNMVMPAMPHMSDIDIAAALNYSLHAWGNDELLPEEFAIILPAEVAALRGLGLTMGQVHELRLALELE
jgi:mono/diheme cytochrome c family protein